MERKRRLGRGLEDISYYFISKEQEEDTSKYLISNVERKCQVVSFVDLFDSRRGALLTSRIGVELCKNGIRTLIIDSDVRFPGIAFVLGISMPGYSFEHFLQDQYQASDIIYNGPFGLKLLAPRFCIKDINKLKMSDVSLMLETIISVEKEIDIIIQRQYEGKFQPFIEDAVFIIPAFDTGMIRAYREIKSFIAGAERKRIGVVISDAADEINATKAYERINRCVAMYCGIKPYFCGYLPDTATFPLSNIVGHISEVAHTNQGVEKKSRLFFERVKYLIESDNLTGEEIENLLA